MVEEHSRYYEQLLLKALADVGVKPLVETFGLIRGLDDITRIWGGLDNFWKECAKYMSAENVRVRKKILQETLKSIGTIKAPSTAALLLELETMIIGDLKPKYDTKSPPSEICEDATLCSDLVRR